MTLVARNIFLVMCVVVLAGACGEAVTAPIIASGSEPTSLAPGTEFEIRYIANEGVLITTREKRVLIDGLHRKYKDAYAYLPDAEREKMEAALPPFDKIDLILVSHRHGDHFHPESVGNYLKNQPTSIFAGSNQVADELAKGFGEFEAVKGRVKRVEDADRSRTRLRFDGIDVELIAISHGSRHADIRNLGHLVSVGGKKFLHIGDAVPEPGNFAALGLEKEYIDVAILPYWFLTSSEGASLVNTYIKPKHIIATHVSPSSAESDTAAVKKYFPAAEVFTRLLESRAY